MLHVSPIDLLQVSDTVVMLQVRDDLGTAAAFARIGLAAAVVVMVLCLVLALVQLRRIHTTVREFTGRVQEGLDPIFDQGRGAVSDVEFITNRLRSDVQRLGDSLRLLSERVGSASDRMERRVEAFDALLEVVQSEAEDLVVASAAAVRGVRAGALSLGGDGSGPEPADADSDTGGENHGPAAPSQERPAGDGEHGGGHRSGGV